MHSRFWACEESWWPDMQYISRMLAVAFLTTVRNSILRIPEALVYGSWQKFIFAEKALVFGIFEVVRDELSAILKGLAVSRTLQCFEILSGLAGLEGRVGWFYMKIERNLILPNFLFFLRKSKVQWFLLWEQLLLKLWQL